jgi:GrpB-like predicted nucleotidyltransferase (UPF0157 family)
VPPPIVVRLVPHDPCWAERAKDEIGRVSLAAGSVLLEMHHIGSTAIPNIVAKPVIDLLAVARSLATLDAAQNDLEALGYACHGEYGLVGRRYYTLSDPDNGERRAQLHCYADGDPAIDRHLAFRDYLRARPELAF